jgi:tetratricopeptide (TPR) repeat protein
MDASVMISLLALFVAIYGIFERQRSAYSALRVRLTELLSAIEDLNIQDTQSRDQAAAQEKEGEGASVWSDGASAGYASRRTLLTYQAVDLLKRLGKARFGPKDTVTPAEYCSLATSLKWCGDKALAITYYQVALSFKQQSLPHTVLRASAICLGETLFEYGRLEEARNSFLRATSEGPEETYADVLDRFFVYMRWLACENRTVGEGGRPELPARGAYVIAANPKWGPGPLSELREACNDINVDGRYAAVTLEDLLEHSMTEILAKSGS